MPDQHGVAEHVEVLLTDYRDVTGTWDKVVSLEMVESIGAQHLETFLACCGRLMKPDGLMLIQAITTHDRLFRIDRYSGRSSISGSSRTGARPRSKRF